MGGPESHAVAGDRGQADLLQQLTEVPGTCAAAMQYAALATSEKQHTRGIWTTRACRMGLVLSGVTAVLGGMAGEPAWAFAATAGLLVGSMGGAVGEGCTEAAQSSSRLAHTIGEIDAELRAKDGACDRPQ